MENGLMSANRVSKVIHSFENGIGPPVFSLIKEDNL